MSSEETGKQQKYTRIGPWQFFPFEFDENLGAGYLFRHMKSTSNTSWSGIWHIFLKGGTRSPARMSQNISLSL